MPLALLTSGSVFLVLPSKDMLLKSKKVKQHESNKIRITIWLVHVPSKTPKKKEEEEEEATADGKTTRLPYIWQLYFSLLRGPNALCVDLFAHTGEPNKIRNNMFWQMDGLLCMGPKSNFGVCYMLLLMGPNWFYLSVAFTVPGEKQTSKTARSETSFTCGYFTCYCPVGASSCCFTSFYSNWGKVKSTSAKKGAWLLQGMLRVFHLTGSTRWNQHC